jgi:NAD(P)-dependent dehydrogenase (short-subunit alcohol dehydrogenase family)
METALAGKRVLITGASSGIGRAIAIAASEAGAEVVLSGRDASRLEETRGMMVGNRHQCLVADLAELSTIGGFAEQLPVLDGFVSCAGINVWKTLKFIDGDHLQRIQSINYMSPLMIVSNLAKTRKLAPGSSVVFISSLAGIIATPGNTAYAGAKGGLIASARILAVEMARQRIRVNCISPGMVMTPMVVEKLSTLSDEQRAADEAAYPLGYGRPEDIAAGAVFLLSPGSRWITGTNLVMDGGYTAK